MEKVEFTLGFSRSFTVFLWALYLGAIAIIFWLPIPYFLKIVGPTLLFLYCRQIWNLHGRRVSKKAVVRIWQDSKGRWGYQTKNGHSAVGRLKNNSFKSIWLLLLNFHFRRRSSFVVIPRDALNSMAYRILSIRLKQHYLPLEK